jgi:tRNA1Val (adenine37-N6)-methyltransferase
MTRNQLKAAGKATSTFYFKQFKVEDGRSTMKVGTDAVLLGAMVKTEGSEEMLEIGTGSGVIALILAQRSSAHIDAVEIDEESANQARENAANSPWSDRIQIFRSSLQEFAEKTSKRYDLIISNPPFFFCSLKSPDKKRNLSRHDESLSFEELAAYAAGLMSDNASLWVILPAREGGKFILIAEKSGLFVHLSISITSKVGRKEHRHILQFKKGRPEKSVESTLVISDGNGIPTKEYKALTKELYLDF